MTTKKWENYEQVTRQLLYDVREFLGLERIEGKQDVKGKRSGTDWNVEAVAYRKSDGMLILVECKRWKSKPSQEILGGFAYRLSDVGAAGGIIVTTLGLQEGAEKVAEAEKIIQIKLDINSTEDSYIAEIANQIFIKVSDQIRLTEYVKIKVTKKE